MDTKIIAMVNQKGGVGKTTSAMILGVGLARQGHKVLLVDSDPQGSLTISMGIQDPDSLSHTLATAMLAEIHDMELPTGSAIIRRCQTRKKHLLLYRCSPWYLPDADLQPM